MTSYYAAQSALQRNKLLRNTTACAATQQARPTTHKARAAAQPTCQLPAGLELFLGHIHGDFHIVNEFANEFVVVLVVQIF